MLDPERTVLIECSDARLGRDKLRARLVSGRLNELDDNLFGRALVPRRKWILGAGHDRTQDRHDDKKAKCFEFLVFHGWCLTAFAGLSILVLTEGTEGNRELSLR